MDDNQHENDQSSPTTTDGYDLGTFRFLKVGWWVWHIVAIAGVFYLGYLYGAAI